MIHGAIRIGNRHYSNCLFWALRQEAKHGGQIRSRPSQYGWWQHWLWSPDGVEWWSFSPVNPKHKPAPPPIFWGDVVKDELS